MRNSILDNLKNVQRTSAQLSGGEVGKCCGVNWVKNRKDYWPHSMVGNALVGDTIRLIQEIESGKLPPYWSMEVETCTKTIKHLEANGFREANRWLGMSLQKDAFVSEKLANGNYRLLQVTTPELMQHWVSVVKPVMLPQKKIADKLLYGWLNSPEFVLLIGWEKGKAVSAGMAFLQNRICGLYFISTLPEFRGRGFAKALVSELIEKSFEQGASEVVLHASTSGAWLYSKLGFETEGTISTFWKLGMY